MAKKASAKKKVTKAVRKGVVDPAKLSRSDANKFWKDHVVAQRTSGLMPAEYCRQHSLNAKYFSRWKIKFDKTAPKSSTAVQTPDSVVIKTPVAVKGVTPIKSATKPLLSPDAVVVKATLSNGVAVELVAHSSKALAQILEQLSK